MHREPTQVAPLPQACPHAPQFAESAARFTQVPPHSVRPGWQERAHAPLEHLYPVWQTASHAPQLETLVARLTHVPEQLVSPAWHEPAVFVQAPDLQTCPFPQAVPSSFAPTTAHTGAEVAD